jgi:leucyl/phenylalanyl-tRNA--protein transferase
MSELPSAPVLPPSRFFPPAESADRSGLVGIGGSLSVPWLVDAYRHGIFPWPITGDPGLLAWWSLDPRAIIELDRFHMSRRLAQTCRGGRFTVSCNRDFRGVIRGCATAAGRKGETWITPPILAAYIELHEQGYAQSVEVWHEGELAGGTYGVAMGAMFAAESMFHTVRDASKVALVHLVHHLRTRGYQLLDIQQLSPHTAQFGAVEIPRKEYLLRLAAALDRPVTFGETLEPWSG